MKKRKKKIVNKKYQLGKSFSFIAVLSVIIVAMLVYIGISLSQNNQEIRQNNEKIVNNIGRIKQIMSLQEDMYLNLSMKPTDNSPDKYLKLANQARLDYNSAIDELNQTVGASEELTKTNNEVIKSNNMLLIISVGIFLVGIFISFFHIMRQTHRIAGPIYVMTRDIKETLEGGKPSMRDLRELDDFKELHGLLRELVIKFIELEEEVKEEDEDG